jgi:hypothetical protein
LAAELRTGPLRDKFGAAVNVELKGSNRPALAICAAFELIE